MSVSAAERPASVTPAAQVEARAGGAGTASKLRELYRYREILLVLVLRDLKARTKQAYLGYVWIVAQPLLLAGVYTFLVNLVRGGGDNSTGFLLVLAGMIPWAFFANSLTDSAESLVRNVDLVRQVYFPREILALYPIIARLVDVGVGCAALGVLMLVSGVPLTGWVLLVPVLLLIEMLYIGALGLLLSAANVASRDVARALPLVLPLLLFAHPVVYTADRLPEQFRPLYLLNPLARLIETFRGAVLGTSTPDLAAIAVIGVVGVVLLVLAQRVFGVFDAVLADVI